MTNPKIENKVFSVILKKPFQILTEAEPRLWRGEATTSPNAKNFVLCILLKKLRTHFEQNPDEDFA
jgi:hypothetical protein